MSKLFHPKRRTLITPLGVWSYFVGNVLVRVKDVYTYIKKKSVYIYLVFFFFDI